MSEQYDKLLSEMSVSRETIDLLCLLEGLIKKWNPKINLVSRSSLENLWQRHIIDSIQVFQCGGPVGHWVDLGSGGGFPGLVIAIMCSTQNLSTRVTLIESDQRKSAFLRTALRETGVRGTVLSKRIESVEPQEADIVSARALADLSGLLEFVERHMKTDGVALFPKGVTWQKEVEQARQKWSFQFEPITSMTESGAVILKIKDVSRV